MEPLSDVTCGDWLLDRVGGWGLVGGVAGTGFDAYARILHPVRAWRGDTETRWGWSEVARRTGRTMHPLVQWFSLTDDEEFLDYDDGWHVGQTEDGRLPADLLAVLTGFLAGSTGTPDDIVAGVWSGWGELHVESGAVLLLMSEGATDADRAKAEAEWREERRRSVLPEVQRMLEEGPFLDWPGREFLLLRTTLAELADPAWPTRGAWQASCRSSCGHPTTDGWWRVRSTGIRPSSPGLAP